MKTFFKTPTTKKSKSNNLPTDQPPEINAQTSSDGAKTSTIKKRRSSSGEHPNPDISSGKSSAKPQFVIPRCTPLAENPLSALPAVLLTEDERVAQAQPFVPPPEATLALETLRTADNWREAVAEFKVDWLINNADRNRAFHEHNRLRVLKLLEEYRAGTHDVVCDNLAQYYLVKEVIEDFQQARRKAKLDEDAQIVHQRRLLQEKLGGPSALVSASKTPAKPNPFLELGTRKAPVGEQFPTGRPGANPLIEARSTPVGEYLPTGGSNVIPPPAAVRAAA